MVESGLRVRPLQLVMLEVLCFYKFLYIHVVSDTWFHTQGAYRANEDGRSKDGIAKEQNTTCNERRP